MSDVQADAQLLREFAATRSEGAFATLVSRYINLVYTAALRQVRQPQAAEDVTQMVFAMLARKATVLVGEPVLAAWLLSATRYTCLDLLKREGRLKRREQKVARMEAQSTEPETTASRNELTSLLDGAFAALNERDRRVIVLKFFSEENDHDAAQMLGVSENALRQRRFRCLEKMRDYFSRHSVDAPADALASAMVAGSQITAPAHLVATVTHYAIASTAGLTFAGLKGVLIMAWVKSNAIAVATVAILLLGGAGLLIASHVRNHEPVAIPVIQPAGVTRLEPPVCESNLRQIGMSLLAYANESRGWLYPVGPPGGDGLPATLGSTEPRDQRWTVYVFYQWNPGVMLCPSDDQPAEQHSYVLNEHLADHKVTYSSTRLGGLYSTDVVVMGEKVSGVADYFMEEKEFSRVVEPFRHGLWYGSNYLYLDLHVSSTPPTAAKKEIDPWDVPIPLPTNP